MNDALAPNFIKPNQSQDYLISADFPIELDNRSRLIDWNQTAMTDRRSDTLYTMK